MIAHLFFRNGRLAWSGYGASGDPTHTHALVVDIGRDFIITGDGRLYLTGPGPFQFEEFSADGVTIAARRGMFGFSVLKEGEAASWRKDRRERAKRKLGRRGRIAEDQRAGGRE